MAVEASDVETHRGVTAISSVEAEHVVLVRPVAAQALLVGRVFGIKGIEPPALGANAACLIVRPHFNRAIARNGVGHSGDDLRRGRRAEPSGTGEGAHREDHAAESKYRG